MADRASQHEAGRLPIPRTRLIGREQERVQGRASLLADAVPILTLTGPGGSGKTRLALAIAADVAGHFAEGVIWVDLAALTDPSLVAVTVAQSFGFVPAAGLPIEEQLIRELRPRQTLLLLDNCEHLLEAVSDLTAVLLAACPAVQVLATSRSPLRNRGEQELPVDPFPLPAVDARPDTLAANEAIRLFIDRAHAANPSFALDETNAPTIAAICRRLDGLPLAIELAAARMKVLSPDALLALLGDRLRLLRGGSRDLPARQQTIRDTIAWSYTLLDPPQQTLFRRLSVFAGGWTLEAAAGIAGNHLASLADVLDEVGALVDHSMVRRQEDGGEPRFTMLETIREFGLAQLAAADDETAVRNRHADWYRSMVEKLDLHHTMQRDADRMHRLVPEQDNIRQALASFAARGDALSLNLLSAAMSIFWPALGQFAEARTWLSQAIAFEADIPRLIRARVWHEAGWLAMCQGELEVAAPLHDEGLRLAREAGEPYLLAEAILSSGTLAFWQGDLERAAALMEEGKQAFQAIDTEFDTAAVKAAAAVIFLGNIAFVAGNLDRAVRHSEEAIGITRALGASAELGYALCGLGYARLLDGAVLEAAACFLEAAALTWTAGDDAFLARLLWAMAAVAAAIEHPEAAARLIGAADALDARTGSAMWPADRIIADWCLARLDTRRDPADLTELRRDGGSQSISQAIALLRAVASRAVGASGAERIWQMTGAPDPGVADILLADPRSADAVRAKTATRPGDLTSHEHQVLGLVSQRLSNAEIAERLAIDPQAAETHVANVLVKLGAETRRDAAAIAVRIQDERFTEADRHAVSPARSRQAATVAGLTPRELDVLRHLTEGHSDREIADALFISRRTVSKHVESILAKLGVRSRGAATAQARRLGIALASPTRGDR